MRRPPDTSLRPAAAGAAEAGQPERDLSEHGGDLVRPVILDLAGDGASSAFRPSDRMVPALGCDDFLLDQSHKLLARVKPRAAMSPRSPGQPIAITSTLRLDPSTPASTRSKTHPILDPQPAKNSAGHILPIPYPQSLGSPAGYDAELRARGNLTVWFTADAVDRCRAESRTTPGGRVPALRCDYRLLKLSQRATVQQTRRSLKVIAGAYELCKPKASHPRILRRIGKSMRGPGSPRRN